MTIRDQMKSTPEPNEPNVPAATLLESRLVIAVKRIYFDAYARGDKTIEYRRSKPPFTAKTFWPGRPVWIATSYNLNLAQKLPARVRRYELAPLWTLDLDLIDRLRTLYAGLAGSDPIAMIHLAIER